MVNTTLWKSRLNFLRRHTVSHMDLQYNGREHGAETPCPLTTIADKERKMATEHSSTKPCSKCGVVKPFSCFSPRQDKPEFVPVSQCKQCRAEKRKQQRLENPEKWRDIQRRSRAKRTKQFHYERARTSHLRNKFGLTDAAYSKMHDAQNGLCAICGNPETTVDTRRGVERKLAVDHCHNGGGVRGLLCLQCNNGIGRFMDNPELLEAAARYIRAHGK